jgi:hypothetical protein
LVTTRYAFRKASFTSQRVIAISLIWIVPVLGAIGAWMLVTPESPKSATVAIDFELPKEFEKGEPPALIDANTGNGFVIAEHLQFVDRVPFLDWKALANWAHSLPDEQQISLALLKAQRAWLLHLREALGSHLHLYTSDQVWVLSSLYPNDCKAIARYVRMTRTRLREKLVNLGYIDPEQPSVVIVADNEDMYYHYVSTYYPDDGEFSFSGGMFIRHGCPHLVITAAALDHLEPVIVHEMTHGSLSHLRLPKWLDEGIAVSTEHSIVGIRQMVASAATRLREHREFWSPERIQQFWTGSSFLRADEGNKLSYDLANLLVMQLGADWDLFVEFATCASYSDGGKEAANQVYSIELGELVCNVLGYEPCGEWSPKPGTWVAADQSEIDAAYIRD